MNKFIKIIRKLVKNYKNKNDETKKIQYIKRIDKANYIGINKKLEQIFNQKDFPLFRAIELETQNKCNNTCSFCPVSAGNDTRERKVMSEELFEKIIDELASLNYSGGFALFSNNEPLLDKRFVKFAKIAKEKLPDASHYIFTNAILLDVELLKKIYPYMDRIIIDNYNNELKMIPTVKKIYEFCIENPHYQEKICIMMRLKDEILASRAGRSPNRKKFVTLKTSCHLPFEQVIIRPDGKLSLCCNDALGEMTLGDLTINSLKEIWYSQTYYDIRKKILESRSNIPLCRYCDFSTTEKGIFAEPDKTWGPYNFKKDELKKIYSQS